MGLVALATVKTAIAETASTHDAALTSLIDGVSRRFDRRTRRKLERDSYTETLLPSVRSQDLPPIAQWPVQDTSLAVTIVGQASPLVEGTDYELHDERLLRRISSSRWLAWELQEISIAYDAGYTLGATGVQVEVPDDLEMACLEQVVWHWRQRSDAAGVGARSGLVSRQVETGDTLQFRDLTQTAGFLPEVFEVVESYRRWV